MRSITVAVLIFIFGVSGQVQAQMKSWTDEDGVTHYGNDPRPAPAKPAPKTEKIECNFQMPEEMKSRDETTFRRGVEALLSEIAACHAKVEGAYAIEDYKQQLASEIYTSTTSAGAIRINRLRLVQEKNESLAPVRKLFLALEKLVKERYNGAAPAWLKDNRDWRYLDKVLSP